MQPLPSPSPVLDNLSIYFMLARGLREPTMNALVCLTAKKVGLPYHDFRAYWIALEDALGPDEEVADRRKNVNAVHCPQLDSDTYSLESRGLIEKHWKYDVWFATEKLWLRSDRIIDEYEARGEKYPQLAEIIWNTLRETTRIPQRQKLAEQILEEAYHEYLKQYTRSLRATA